MPHFEAILGLFRDEPHDLNCVQSYGLGKNCTFIASRRSGRILDIDLTYTERVQMVECDLETLIPKSTTIIRENTLIS
ncbi:hypothetical protein AVEN_128280-1, partial [Araneus ventricosus]